MKRSRARLGMQTFSSVIPGEDELISYGTRCATPNRSTTCQIKLNSRHGGQAHQRR